MSLFDFCNNFFWSSVRLKSFPLLNIMLWMALANTSIFLLLGDWDWGKISSNFKSQEFSLLMKNELGVRVLRFGS